MTSTLWQSCMMSYTTNANQIHMKSFFFGWDIMGDIRISILSENFRFPYPICKKTCSCHMRTVRTHPHSLISAFVVHCLDSIIPKVASLAQSGASLTANQVVACSSPGLATYFHGDLSWNNFYGHSPLLLIQEGQRSVSGESMCTKYWLAA